MTLDEAINKINRIRTEAPAEGARIMKEEVAPHSKTGALQASIDAIPLGMDTWSIGTNIHYAKYIRYGRGEVRPINKKSLHWIEGGGDVFSMYSSPTQPDNFTGRTADKLLAFIRSL